MKARRPLAAISLALGLGAALAGRCAADSGAASHHPESRPDTVPEDVERSDPDDLRLPTWGSSERKWRPLLWPGNHPAPGDARTPADTGFTPEIQAEPEDAARAIPDLFLADYFGGRPGEVLVDPQALLASHERIAIAQALEAHRVAEGVAVYLLVFREEQVLPEFKDLPTLVQNWFTDAAEDGVVIAYWLGAPGKTDAVYTDALRRRHGHQLDRVFATAVSESYSQSAAFAQLDHFAYAFLWNLAQLAPHPPDATLATSTEPAPPPAPPPANPTAEDVGDSPGRRDAAAPAWIPAAAGGSVLALSAVGLSLLRSRRRGEQAVVLAEAAPAKRLGAPHSGGTGASIEIL